MDQHPADSSYHRLLPHGQVLDGTPMTEHPSPSLAHVDLLPLEPMLVPEAPRGGRDGVGCWHCTQDGWVWRDAHWHLTSFRATGLPFAGALSPNAHVLLDTAPVEVLQTLGGVLQRLSRAVKLVPGAARLHYARFNDGSEHWHHQVMVRPAGMMQARGAMSYLWSQTLPELPEETWREHAQVVARAMAADGGEALL